MSHTIKSRIKTLNPQNPTPSPHKTYAKPPPPLPTTPPTPKATTPTKYAQNNRLSNHNQPPRQPRRTNKPLSPPSPALTIVPRPRPVLPHSAKNRYHTTHYPIRNRSSPLRPTQRLQTLLCLVVRDKKCRCISFYRRVFLAAGCCRGAGGVCAWVRPFCDNTGSPFNGGVEPDMAPYRPLLRKQYAAGAL